MFGWILLANGAFLSGTLGAIRAVALGLMAILMLGVRKRSTDVSVIATAGRCVVMCPLGIRVLKDGRKPVLREGLFWSSVVILVVILLFFFGQAG